MAGLDDQGIDSIVPRNVRIIPHKTAVFIIKRLFRCFVDTDKSTFERRKAIRLGFHFQRQLTSYPFLALRGCLVLTTTMIATAKVIAATPPKPIATHSAGCHTKPIFLSTTFSGTSW
jgi:hypothetical protein